jgi:hypothetical protein
VGSLRKRLGRLERVGGPTPEIPRPGLAAEDEAFTASLSGLTLDGKIEAFEAEIARMEGEPWEA